MGLLIAPMSGAYVADFMIARGRYASDAPEPPAFRLLPLFAWLFGKLVCFATLPQVSFGLGLFQITRAPTVDALLAAAAFLLVAGRLGRWKNAEFGAAQEVGAL